MYKITQQTVYFLGKIAYCLGVDSAYSINWAQALLLHYHLLFILLVGLI